MCFGVDNRVKQTKVLCFVFFATRHMFGFSVLPIVEAATHSDMCLRHYFTILPVVYTATVSLSPGFVSSGSATYFLALPVKDNTMADFKSLLSCRWEGEMGTMGF